MDIQDQTPGSDYTTVDLGQRPTEIPLARENGRAGYLHGHRFTVRGSSEVDAGDRFIGTMSRNALAPSMAPVTERMVQWLDRVSVDPNDTLGPSGKLQGNLIYVQSGPGLGKTQAARVLAKATGFDFMEIASGSTGRDNMDNLVVAKDVDTRPPGTALEKVNQALRYGSQELRNSVREALEEEGFPLEQRHSADGAYFEVTDKSLSQSFFQTSDQTTDGMPRNEEDTFASVGDRRKRHLQMLKDIAEQQKLESPHTGIVSKEGPLLKALIKIKEHYENEGVAKPAIIAIDEFNRYANLGSRLQNFWEVVAGKSSDSVTITGPGDATYTFTPDMLRNTLVYCTGNDPAKEPGAHELSESLRSRFGENFITINDRAVGPQDYQHRLEQLLIGIPLSLHAAAGRGAQGSKWDNNPQAFGQQITRHLALGLPGTSEKQIAPDIAQMLENERLTEGLGKVAAFFHEANALINDQRHEGHKAISRELRAGSKDENLYFDQRILRDILASAEQKPLQIASGYDIDTGLVTQEQEISPANFGSRLTGAIMKLVEEKVDAEIKPNTHREIFKLLHKHDLISKDQLIQAHQDLANEMHETRAQQPEELVADLLNYDRHKDFKEFAGLRDIIKETMEVRSPGDEPNIVRSQLAEQLEKLREQEQQVFDRLAKSEHGVLPDTASQIVLPEAQLQSTADGRDVTFTLGLAADVVLDGITRKEQLSKETQEQILAQKDQPGTIASTHEVLLGLALLDHTHDELAGLFNQGFAKALEADIAEGKRNIAQEALNKAGVEEMPAKKNLLEKAQATYNAAMSWLSPGSGQRPEAGEKFLEAAEALAENRHESGLALTTLHTLGYEANGLEQEGGSKHFDDTLTVVNWSPPQDKEASNEAGEEASTRSQDQTLIVGTTTISDTFKAKLAEKGVTYISTQEAEAVKKITSRLRSITAQARSHLQTVDERHVDIVETERSGLLRDMEVALNLRTGDVDHAIEQEPTGMSQDDRIDSRLQALAQRMCDPKMRSMERNFHEHVTTLHAVEHEGRVVGPLERRTALH
jgi:hypothetical protein